MRVGVLVPFVISLSSGYIVSNVDSWSIQLYRDDLLGIQLHITERKDLCYDLQNWSMSSEGDPN